MSLKKLLNISRTLFCGHIYEIGAITNLFSVIFLLLMCGSVISLGGDNTDKELLLYQKLFHQRRTEQITAVKSVIAIDDSVKQHKMVSLLLGKLFEVMSQSRVKVVESGFVPGQSMLPENQELKSDVSNILENVLFFGEMLLRLPDVCHQLYDKNKEWQDIVNWSITFANETKFLDNVSQQVLHLMTQELELVEKDPNYVNPFKAETKKIREAAKLDEAKRLKEDAEKKREQKRRDKTKNKGPRLSKPRYEL